MPPKAKSTLLKRLRRAFSGLSRCRLLQLREAYRLVGDSVRIPYEGFPMELLLGRDGNRLLLHPEDPLAGKGEPNAPVSFVLEDPERCRSIGLAGLERSKQFTWEAVIRRIAARVTVGSGRVGAEEVLW